MSERRILVLGASGFLGPHLVAAAVQSGARVAAASREPGRAPAIGGWAPHELARFDALDPARTRPMLDELRPDAIVLATALARIDECERDPARARVINADLPATVADFARSRGLRLVALSTDLVFGARPPASERFREDEPPAPLHVYGATKAEGEARVLAADPGALVVRLPLLYGDSLGRGLGASDALFSALERGERPALFTDEWRTPLEAGNAARAVIELLESAERGLLHVAGPERLSRHELGLALLRQRGLSRAAALERVRTATRAELGLAHLRASDVSLDASRARGLLSTSLLAPTESHGNGSLTSR